MSITYIGRSQAKADQIEKLREFLTTVVRPAILASQGCEGCQFWQSETDPTQFTGIEVWASVDAHRASINNIARASIDAYMQLVAAPPSGGYYHAI